MDEREDAKAALAHRQAWDLIPWVLNGTADEAEREQLQSHLLACEDCRAEFEFQHDLQRGMAMTPAAPGLDAGRALQRFWAAEKTEQALQLPRHKPWAARRWLVAAVVLQAVGLAGLSAVIAVRTAPAQYQVLSRPEPVGAVPPVIRIVPAPGLQMGELRALLARSDLQLVQASADAGHLGLALDPGARFSRDSAVQRLRAEPGILLAEPIQQDGH